MSTLSPPPSNGVDNEVDTLTGNGLPQETTATSTTVASASASSSASPSTASTACLEFARLIGRLKVTPRTGWVRRGVPMRYESVADHSWRVAALSLLLLVDSNQEDDKNNDNKDNNALLHNTSPVAPDEQLPTERQATSGTLDVAKCMQLAIVHDLAECIVGDIAPDDNIPKEVKKAREMQAMSTIASVLGRATRTLSTQGPPRDEQPSSSSPISTAESFLLHLFHEYEERTSAEAIAVKDLDLLDMIVQAYEYEERFGMDLGDFFASTPPSKFQTPSLACMAHELHEQRASAKQTVDKKSLSTSTTSAQSNMSDQDEPQRQQQCELLSRADQAFVTEYAMASKLDAAEISNMLQAYHQWQHPR
jgi:putative hydrolases of HD superfamily